MLDVMFVMDMSYHVTGDSIDNFYSYKLLMMETVEALTQAAVSIRVTKKKKNN